MTWKQRPPKGYMAAYDNFMRDDDMRHFRRPSALGKTDANQSQVVGWYEELHCSVIDLHELGHNIPDLLVGCGKVCDQLVEVKTESGELTEGQAVFHRDWRGKPPVVIRTHQDVIEHVHRMRQLLRTHP